MYYEIGNLVEWDVYGKISKITKGEEPFRQAIVYKYDASGNRIQKNVYPPDKSLYINTTHYVRDATGNVMAVYTSGDAGVNNGQLTQTELHLYGSSRLGVYNVKTNVQTESRVFISMNGVTENHAELFTFTRANKFFEYTNHLGNVLGTVTDKKIGVFTGTGNSILSYYKADIATANDYYPFGMRLPGRKYTASSGYRYGFNGKEKSDEVYGEGNIYDYGFRIYNPRLGKFLSVDPLTRDYPSWSPYPFAMNRPIDGINLDGLEWIHFKVQFKVSTDGENILLSKTVVQDYRNKSESELILIHGNRKPYGSSWLSKYPQGFGKKGEGVLYTYEQVDGNGKVLSSNDNMEVVTALKRHGFYAGQGCITKSGELITPGEFGNYDFGMMPIDMPDAIAKEHDFLQDEAGHKGFMHTDYLNSDVLFLIKMQKFEKAYKDNPDYIDPFTRRKVSEETKKFTNKAIALFQAFINLKVLDLKNKLDKKEITKEQYESDMYLLNHPNRVQNGPMPNPSDFLNKDSK